MVYGVSLGCSLVSIGEYLRNIVRTMKMSRKPDKDEFMLTFKVVVVGLTILGSMGFIFQLIGSAFQFARFGPIPKDITIVFLAAILAIVLGVIVYARRRYRL